MDKEFLAILITAIIIHVSVIVYITGTLKFLMVTVGFVVVSYILVSLITYVVLLCLERLK